MICERGIDDTLSARTLLKKGFAVEPVTVISSPVGPDFVARTRETVHLGPLRLEIRSNEAHFKELRYFPVAHPPSAECRPDHVLSFCNLDLDGPWSLEKLQKARDKGYRAKRFAMGFYLTDHFGPPAYLLKDPAYWVFAKSFEQIVWPYFAKLLLTTYSMRAGMLHLKAGAIALDGAATLLVGRGGGGKTLLLTRLCQQGAKFLSNTHVLIRDDTVIAVPTAMRVRADALFGPLIAERQLSEGIKEGEYVADPRVDFGWQSTDEAPLRNICLVDYRNPKQKIIRELDRRVLFDYMEHFGLALGAYYGLKEDLLDHAGGDVETFAHNWARMKEYLRATIERSRCYYLSCDAMDDPTLGEIVTLLQRGS